MTYSSSERLVSPAAGAQPRQSLCQRGRLGNRHENSRVCIPGEVCLLRSQWTCLVDTQNMHRFTEHSCLGYAYSVQFSFCFVNTRNFLTGSVWWSVGGTMSLVRCVPYDWVGVGYSLKKEDDVWLISKGWDKHSSLFTRQKPGAFVIPAPIWTAAFVCSALWLQWSLETCLAVKSHKNLYRAGVNFQRFWPNLVGIWARGQQMCFLKPGFWCFWNTLG